MQALVALCLMLIALTIYLTVGKLLAQTILVSCAVFYNCVKYSSPLSVAKLVIATHSVEFMPLPLTLACLLCSLLWGMYGFLLSDIWITVPNSLGLIFSIAQGEI
jgi:solute carrier family 50 (sugar transporter)